MTVDYSLKGDNQMELFLMTITTGIMVGGIYALIALGWVLIYKCSGVLNLAMGELTLIGAYVSLSFYSMGVPFLFGPAVFAHHRVCPGDSDRKDLSGQADRRTRPCGHHGDRGAFLLFQGRCGTYLGNGHEGVQPSGFPIEAIHSGPTHHRPGLSMELFGSHRPSVVFVGFFQYTRWGLPCRPQQMTRWQPCLWE